MDLDEAAAKRLILAQAIETAQPQGPWLGAVERDRIDRESRDACAAEGGAGTEAATRRFLDLRAQRILTVIHPRDPVIAALQSTGPALAHMGAWTAAATFLLGVFSDRLADPHRVDLLSLPLLAIVLWNLVAYLFLALRRALNRNGPARSGFESIRRWMQGLGGRRRRLGSPRASVMGLFYLRWNDAAASLQAQRWKVLLHVAALGWAAGLAVSLLVRGLVVEYRVGWESTFLDVGQVHAILSAILLPVVALFPFESFSVREVANLQLGPASAGLADRRWVWMYVALLGVAVIAPRALLAGVALWQATALARRVPVDLGQPYFQRLLSLVHPARVRLGLIGHAGAPRQGMLRVLARDAEAPGTLISSSQGDALCLVELARAPASPLRLPHWRWRRLGAIWPRPRAMVRASDQLARGALDEADVILMAVASADDLKSVLPGFADGDTPVLVLVDPGDLAGVQSQAVVAQCRAAARGTSRVAAVLPFDAFARCWVQEPVLLEAIGRCLVPARQPGYARLQAAWHERHLIRFGRSMAVLAAHFLHVARQARELPPVSAWQLLKPGERQAAAQARQAAQDAMLEQIRHSQADMWATLKRVHRLDEAHDSSSEHRPEPRFAVQQPVSTPQAGMAGAATGAAMGASVDLMVGGLTLGAAAGVGALLGGGAAWIAAAWKNRTLPGGATVVQPGDEMMQAVVEAGLLRYLGAIHESAEANRCGPAWEREVIAAVEAQRAVLALFWAHARQLQGTAEPPGTLAGELETMARRLLGNLYPDCQLTG